MSPDASRDTKVERFPLLPHHPFEPLRGLGSCPGEDGKDPGRTARCGGAVKIWMNWIYAFQRRPQGEETNLFPLDRFRSVPSLAAKETRR